MDAHEAPGGRPATLGGVDSRVPGGLHPTRAEDLPAWFDEVTVLFIVGCPRSGTTWVQRMLLALPDAVGGEESHFFEAFAPALEFYDRAAAGPRKVGPACYLDPDGFLNELRRLWVLFHGPLLDVGKPPRVLVEKTPGHVRFAREISLILPRARFAHLVRDGRAVVSSLLAASGSWGRTWAPGRAGGAARMWRDHVRDGQAIRGLVGEERYIEVRYEDFFQDPVASLRTLARFAGLEPTAEQLQEAVRLNDAAAVRSGVGASAWSKEPAGFLRRAAPDGWRDELSRWQLLKVQHYAGSTLRRLGYA